MSVTCPECDGYVLTVVKQTEYAIVYRCEDCGYTFRIRSGGEVNDDD